MRSEALARLLKHTGFADAERLPLAGDASTRRYERLILPNRRAILMDAPVSAESAPCPPGATPAQRRTLGWNATSRLAASRVEAFAAVAAHLSELGLAAPEIYGVDLAAGYMVIEDLGDDLFARVLDTGANEVALYQEAARVLAHVHAAPVPARLQGPGGASWPLLEYDALALEVNADLFVEWLPRAFTIRDYHAENLLWLPERDGLKRVGLLDFQDAVRGWRAWDFAMLLHDARRDVSALAAEAALHAYLDATGASDAEFRRELAVLGAINAMRILGIFARLASRDGKQRYLGFMPREWGHLARALQHPALEDARTFVESVARSYLERAA